MEKGLVCNSTMSDAIDYIQEKTRAANTITQVMFDKITDLNTLRKSSQLNEIYELCLILIDYTAAADNQLDAVCKAHEVIIE